MTAKITPPPTPRLAGAHRRTYDAIFRHPVAHNLQWRDVHAMLSALGEAVEQENGNLKVTCNGQTFVLRRSRGKDIAENEELMEIRHFLEKSGAALPPPLTTDVHLLVVIDHRHARIYRTELHGTVPQRVAPYDPTGEGRHLLNVQDDSNGQRKPEHVEFYESVARALHGAEKILIFGGGTGASSAMDQLLAELERRHAELAGRIVGAIVVDQQHLTEDQLLARARDFYAALAANEAHPVSSDEH